MENNEDQIEAVEDMSEIMASSAQGDSTVPDDSYFEDEYWLTFDTHKIEFFFARLHGPSSDNRLNSDDLCDAISSTAHSSQASRHVSHALSNSVPISASTPDKSASGANARVSRLSENSFAELHAEFDSLACQLQNSWTEADRFTIESAAEGDVCDVGSLPSLRPSTGNLHLAFELTMEESSCHNGEAEVDSNADGYRNNVNQPNDHAQRLPGSDNAIHPCGFSNELTADANGHADPAGDVQEDAYSKKSPGPADSGYSSNPVSPQSVTTSIPEPFGKCQSQVFIFPPRKLDDSNSRQTNAKDLEDAVVDVEATRGQPPPIATPTSPPRPRRSAKKCLRSKFDLQASKRFLDPLIEASNESSSSEILSVISSDVNMENCENPKDTVLINYSKNTDRAITINSPQASTENENKTTRRESNRDPALHKLICIPEENFYRETQKANFEDQKCFGFEESFLQKMYFKSSANKKPMPVSTSSQLQLEESPRSKRLTQKQITMKEIGRGVAKPRPRFSNSVPGLLEKADGLPSPESSDPDSETAPPYPVSAKARRRNDTSAKKSNAAPGIKATKRVSSARRTKIKTKNLSPTARNMPASCADSEEDVFHNSVNNSLRCSQDYIALTNVADMVFSRLPQGGRNTNGVLNSARLVEHLNKMYRSEISLEERLGEVSGDFALHEDIDSPSLSSPKKPHASPTSIVELRALKKEEFEDFSRNHLTVANCIDELRGALLASNIQAVETCRNYIFDNLHYVRCENSDFLWLPPELVMLLLCNQQSIVLGPHGFPLAYRASEREVLKAIDDYINHQEFSMGDTRPLRELLLNTVDPQVSGRRLLDGQAQCKKCKLNRQSSDEKHSSGYKKHGSRETHRTCRRPHEIKYRKSKLYVTATGTRQEHLLKPSLSSASSSSYSSLPRNASKKRKSNPCTKLLASPSRKKQVRDEPEVNTVGVNENVLDKLSLNPAVSSSTVDDVCNSAHTLRRLYFSTRIRQGSPFITGLGFEYAHRGRRRYVAFGTCTGGEEYRLMTKQRVHRQDTDSNFGVKQVPEIECNQKFPFDEPPPSKPTTSQIEDGKPLLTSVKLETGEHVTGVRVQGSTVLHNIEITTNKRGRVLAHPYSSFIRSDSSSACWETVDAPFSAGKDSNPFCMQSMVAEVMYTDSEQSKNYLKKIGVVWAVLARGQSTGGSQPKQNATEVFNNLSR